MRPIRPVRPNDDPWIRLLELLAHRIAAKLINRENKSTDTRAEPAAIRMKHVRKK